MCCDSMKLQALLAGDERVKTRLDTMAENLYGTAVSIRSMADRGRQDIEGFEVQEDVYKEYGMEGYSCSR